MQGYDLTNRHLIKEPHFEAEVCGQVMDKKLQILLMAENEMDILLDYRSWALDICRQNAASEFLCYTKRHSIMFLEF